MNKISLAGNWNVSWTDGDHGVGDNYLDPMQDPQRYMSLSFPNSLQHGLMEAGIVDDPREGINFLKARWVEEKCWILRREFNVPQEALGQPAYLHLEVLDGVARVAVNGVMLGEHANAFRPACFSLVGLLKQGKNEISILLESGLFKVADLPVGDYLNKLEVILNKRMHLRQAQYQFGWDWNPRLVFIGMHGCLEIVWGTQPWLKQVSVLGEVAPDLASAKIRVRPLMQWGGDDVVQVSFELTGPDGLVAISTEVLEPGESEPELVLNIQRPRLWWPRGYGEPYLYSLRLSVKVEGQEVASWQGRTGLRRVEIDQPVHPVAGRFFHLKINNLPVFCKGANWVPPEMSGHEVAPERIKRLVELAEELNMNTLRIWGGGVWANHTLLDLADEHGFLVWHDLLFACAKYPGDRPEFLHEVELEVAWGIREFSRHPSLAVWCGNNENEWGLWEWGYKRYGRTAPDLVLFHHIFPALMARLDPTRPYWPSSPYSSVDKTPSDPTIGDQHPWGVSLGVDDINFWAYRNYVDRFPNEGGVLGCAPGSSLRRFLKGSEMQMRSFAWEHHDNTIMFWKAEKGFAIRSVEYWLGLDIDNLDVETYSRASGMIQSEGLKEYILNYRRRWPSTSSAIYWMFNDSWPTVHGWPTFDYYLNRKLSFYPVKRSFADVVVVLADEDNEIGVYVVNDTRQEINVIVQTGDFTPGTLANHNPPQNVTVPPFTSLRTQSMARDPQRIYYAVVLDQAGRLIHQDRLLLRRWAEWEFHFPKIQVDVINRDGKRYARYQSELWVWNVILDPDCQGKVQDDVFDLLPGIPYDVPLAENEVPRTVAFTGNDLLTKK